MEGALLFYLYEEVGGESLARSVCSWGGAVAGKSATLKMFKILMNGMVMRIFTVFGKIKMARFTVSGKSD